MKIVLTFDSMAEMKAAFKEFGSDPEGLLKATVGPDTEGPADWTTNAEPVPQVQAWPQVVPPQPEPTPQPAPTYQVAPPTVTEAELKKAMRNLATSGKTAKLTEIMHELGVNAFPELTEDKYPALAEKLKAAAA